MIAALYVQEGGCYYGLPDVDPWPESRDARLYAGPWPVVAHPPCARWCQMAGLVEHRYGIKRGEDEGCFEAALNAVLTYGGVLEHPAYTLAWERYQLQRPVAGSWQKDPFSGVWVTEVAQVAYGHRGRKKTWLLANIENPPTLDWSEPPALAWCGWGDYDRYRDVERMSKRERSATPPAFRDMLLDMARQATTIR